MEKLQELFTDRVNNTLWATKKHFYDKFEVEQNLNRLDMLKQFVQFLVENNKIDFTKDNIVEFWYYWTEWYCDKYDNILMNLAIQDNPIEFLVSILK